MADPMPPGTSPKTMADIKSILVDLRALDVNQMDKNVFICLLSGFKVIVEVYENELPQRDDADNEETILGWMHLYLDIQLRVTSYKTLSAIFSKTVPIAITYCIGWLRHITNVTNDFYKRLIEMVTKFIIQTDKGILKNLENCGRGLTALLWKAFDKVDCFNNQLMLLNLVCLILENLSDYMIHFEISNVSNINASIREKMFILLITLSKTDLYEKLSREIIRLYNLNQGKDASIHSFACESFKIGNQFSFLKPKNFSRFWIDINSKPKTLSFLALFSPKKGNIAEKVEVSLQFKAFSRDKENLKIEFESPANISGTSVDIKELKTMTEAYTVLTKSEMKRFLKIFKVQTSELFEKENIEISNIENSMPDNVGGENILFKRPSLQLFESAVRATKSNSVVSEKKIEENLKMGKVAKNQNTISTQDDLFESAVRATKSNSVVSEKKIEENLKREKVEKNQTTISTQDDFLAATSNQAMSKDNRFFKNPRQPKKIEIPWKKYPARKTTNQQRKRSNKVQPVQPMKSTLRPSEKLLNLCHNNSAPCTATSSSKRIFDGPSTSQAVTQLQSLLIEKKTEEINFINKLKTLSVGRDTFNSYPKTNDSILNAVPRRLGSTTSSWSHGSNTSETDSNITNFNNEPIQQGASNVEINNGTQKRQCSFLKRKTENTVPESDFDSLDEIRPACPRRKRLTKKRPKKQTEMC